MVTSWTNSSGRVRGLTLVEVLVAILLLGILAALFLGSMPVNQHRARKRDCMSTLREISLCVNAYVSRYGSSRDFPPAPGHGFFDTLGQVPDEQTAITRGKSGLYWCRAVSPMPGARKRDYCEPIGPIGGADFPGNRPIVRDHITNHDPSGQDDMNILLFNGSVITANPGSPEWNEAVLWTR